MTNNNIIKIINLKFIIFGVITYIILTIKQLNFFIINKTWIIHYDFCCINSSKISFSTSLEFKKSFTIWP